MKLTLLQPKGSLNWMLVAEEMSDPANWNQFLLNHGPDTERFQFESAAEKAAAEHTVTLTPYRLMCKRGLCGLEYDWKSEEPKIRAHARKVGEQLGVEIQIAGSQPVSEPVSAV